MCVLASSSRRNPVVLARKILSCVARVQRFGAARRPDLCGRATECHGARTRPTTFGLLRESSIAEARGYIEQLTGQGLLQQAGEEFPVLALTPAGVDLLKNADSRPGLSLARQKRPPKGKARTQTRAEVDSWQNVDRSLFDRLRALRLDVARARVPPRHLSRRDASRAGPCASDLLAALPVWHRRAQGVGPRGTVPRSDPRLRIDLNGGRDRRTEVLRDCRESHESSLTPKRNTRGGRMVCRPQEPLVSTTSLLGCSVTVRPTNSSTPVAVLAFVTLNPARNSHDGAAPATGSVSHPRCPRSSRSALAVPGGSTS
jgi:hypothetical protein